MNKRTSFLLASAATAIALILTASCANEAVLPADSSSFSFGLIGDQQYNAAQEKQFSALLTAINSEPLAFVVHVGDFKAGGNSPCTDELFAARFAEFDQSRHPFIYTPGDNDWVDCRHPSNGAMAPLDRLRKLRELFFAAPKSLGRSSLALNLQGDMFAADPLLSRYRENAMWVHQGVVFATFNIQGSNDNLGFDAANDAEQRERTQANIRWLNEATARAKSDDIIGMAVFSQANPGFEESPTHVAKSAYVPFLNAFEAEAERLGKPILYVHGDSHQFRVDNPYKSPLDRREIKNVTRVEGYGSPNVNWVRVTVGKQSGKPFSIESGRFLPMK
ncbi:MAG: metallophosphoesterase [Rhodocyclaceae bacterium]|nr:metallophosphoesterase [Rhodocyclaceae bacterium]